MHYYYISLHWPICVHTVSGHFNTYPWTGVCAAVVDTVVTAHCNNYEIMTAINYHIYHCAIPICAYKQNMVID